ncbi:MAG: hypothetical protein ACYS6W_05485 [Planctomycetota bacterium]|jgi:hypothetical protein
MIKKGDNFFEEHIEKIVLAVVGLVCIWLFLTRVLFSPNVVIYEGNKLGPGDIDDYILASRQAGDLEEKLNDKPEPKSYKPSIGDFDGMIVSAIRGIDIKHGWPLPIHSSMDFSDRRKYRIPEIGEVNDVTIEYIRAVAYVPTVEINEQNVYDKAAREVNDIDFVTVEAKFDVKGLYERCYESFAGSQVEEEEWRDPCLAKPIFAAVQLQRQEELADGSWSDWQIVPRTKIDHRKKMFEVIEDVEDLPPGGMKVRLLQFDNRQVRVDLLQPKAYRIASAQEEWFPPSLHKDFRQQLREKELEERRAAIEAAREAEKGGREQELERRREERGMRSTESFRRSGSRMDEEYSRSDEFFAVGGTSARERRPRTRRGERLGDREVSPRRREREEREREQERLRLARSRDVSRTTSVEGIYREFNMILLTRRTDFARMREPLVFWAHDDTVETEKRYRYRIRLGVFNPVAGTNQFSEGYRGLKNKVVLWSEFSDITEDVEIPGRLYFFARDTQEAAKIVTVQVSRYVLGYWNSKDFAVKQGEVIGKVVETETTPATRPRATISGFSEEYAAAYEGYSEEELRAMGASIEPLVGTVPETIDYSTGAVLVDVIAVNDWSGVRNLHRRGYFDMLYTFDGMNIERMPIRARYWAKDVVIMFNEIRKSEREPRKPFRDWGSKVTEGARVISRPPEYDERYSEEYYREYLDR